MDVMVGKMPESFSIHPRVAMAVAGLGLGIISAIVFGLIAFIASKIVKKSQ
jgi:hypothetical protein